MEDVVMIEIIKKAIRNGWKGEYSTDVIAKGDNKVAIKSAMGLIGRGTIAPIYSIIFHHSFAKKFFIPDDAGIIEQMAWKDGERDDVWKKHLQEMVIEDNPVEYLKKFL